MVKKFMVENYVVETWGLNILQPSKSMLMLSGKWSKKVTSMLTFEATWWKSNLTLRKQSFKTWTKYFESSCKVIYPKYSKH